MNWSLYEDYPNHRLVDSGAINSSASKGMLEFFNLSKGKYNLEMSTEVQRPNQNWTDWLWDSESFTVGNDPVANSVPWCEMYANGTADNGTAIAHESNINADAGTTFTFEVVCSDNDNDDISVNAIVESTMAPLSTIIDANGPSNTTFVGMYNLTEAGIYVFAISVKDEHGAKRVTGFTVTALNNTVDSNNNTATNETLTNETLTNETLEQLAEESGIPSVSMLLSVVAVAFIATRRRN